MTQITFRRACMSGGVSIYEEQISLRPRRIRYEGKRTRYTTSPVEFAGKFGVHWKDVLNRVKLGFALAENISGSTTIELVEHTFFFHGYVASGMSFPCKSRNDSCLDKS